MEETKIDWCDSTWNPVSGCMHDCEYCYARKIAERFGGSQKYANVFELSEKELDGSGHAKPYPYSFSPTFHRYRLEEYLNKKGRNIFVCSMAELFGEWVPDSWIDEVMDACEKAPQHNYLFLTKNPARYDRAKLPKESSFWFGTTVTSTYDWNTNAYTLYRKLPHHYTFLSIEPILEGVPVDENIKYFDWVIIGAETGNRKNRVVPKREWIENIVDQCREWGTPVFMKSSLAEIWGELLIQEFTISLK